MLDILEKTDMEHLDKTKFLSISISATFLPKLLTEDKIWKKLSASAKEVYRALSSNYDYELGVAKITHAQILNEAGLGGNATVVKSLDTLEEKGFIVRVETKTKSHYYLLPHQEKFYSKICDFEERDLSIYYTINKKSKKDNELNQTTHKLFFRVCYNLSCLDIDNPDKLIDKYSFDGNRLRIILSMCDSIYIAKKYNLVKDMNLNAYLMECLKKGNITENIFDDSVMNKIKNMIRKNKQNITE